MRYSTTLVRAWVAVLTLGAAFAAGCSGSGGVKVAPLPTAVPSTPALGATSPPTSASAFSAAISNQPLTVSGTTAAIPVPTGIPYATTISVSGASVVAGTTVSTLVGNAQPTSPSGAEPRPLGASAQRGDDRRVHPSAREPEHRRNRSQSLRRGSHLARSERHAGLGADVFDRRRQFGVQPVGQPARPGDGDGFRRDHDARTDASDQRSCGRRTANVRRLSQAVDAGRARAAGGAEHIVDPEQGHDPFEWRAVHRQGRRLRKHAGGLQRAARSARRVDAVDLDARSRADPHHGRQCAPRVRQPRIVVHAAAGSDGDSEPIRPLRVLYGRVERRFATGLHARIHLFRRAWPHRLPTGFERLRVLVSERTGRFRSARAIARPPLRELPRIDGHGARQRDEQFRRHRKHVLLDSAQSDLRRVPRRRQVSHRWQRHEADRLFGGRRRRSGPDPGRGIKSAPDLRRVGIRRVPRPDVRRRLSEPSVVPVETPSSSIRRGRSSCSSSVPRPTTGSSHPRTVSRTSLPSCPHRPRVRRCIPAPRRYRTPRRPR